jgi:hypothetical protein
MREIPTCGIVTGTALALTCIDDDACNSSAVSAYPLRRAVHDDIRSVLDRADQIA